MKKVLFSLLGLALLLVSCQPKTGFNYQIKGTLPDSSSNGQTVYLMSLENELIDSAVVRQDRYTLKGHSQEHTLCQLNVGQRMSHLLILEKGRITIKSDDIVAFGTPMNDSIAAFVARQEKISDESETMKQWNQRSSACMMEALNSNQSKEVRTFMAIFYLANVSPSLDDYDRLMEALPEDIKQYPPIAQHKALFDAIRATSAGKMFTDFTIPGGNLDGSDARLSDYVGKGKYILVDFWASWCGPCRREIPVIAEAYQRFHGKKFDVLGVAVWDKREASLQAAKELGIVWNQIVDAQHIPTEIYGIEGIPHIILFAPDGTIVERDLRGQQLLDAVAAAVTAK
ncbi:MAG: AhpC/TSA family protein [Bacteroidales bacterium]|nr:AhpC/TSA family protein [Bacteroidales bacterium]